MSEQWKLNGDCEVCRKRNYCQKDCSKRKEYIEQLAQQTISNMFLKRLLKKK